MILVMYVGAASSQPPFTFSALSHYAREKRIRQDLRTTSFSRLDASCSHFDRPTKRIIMRGFAFARIILAFVFQNQDRCACTGACAISQMKDCHGER